MKKREQYQELLKLGMALLLERDDPISKMANCCALINEKMPQFWVGFYRVKGNQLLLGPFQGPSACTTIPFGKGVCGTAWEKQSTIIVPDVHKFPGHIACSAASNSEIVVPVFQNDKVIAVLDIDSTSFDAFDEEDQKGLEELMKLI